ncbi:phospholipase A2 inhibitor and Ly6/PLAUR domain-containing protein-like [Dendropsophus ebraccatus]|uniref:phospholipase A2 inhibitor and Ly6/PLAUR domain-containing protein-like n=1 Tax=Dendropsophus ebraccatus TaxID=150705 RepID=UPI0038318752
MPSLHGTLFFLQLLAASVGKTYINFFRKCVSKDECDFKGNIGLDQMRMWSVTTCCETDSCTPPDPLIFPVISLQPNGLVCPSCKAEGSAWCDPSGTIECTGDEDRCLLMTTQVTGNSRLEAVTAYRGCATQSVCRLGVQSYSAGGISMKIQYACSSG